MLRCVLDLVSHLSIVDLCLCTYPILALEPSPMTLLVKQDSHIHIRHPNAQLEALQSRQPDYDDGLDDNEQITTLLKEVFISVVKAIALDESFWK